MTELVCAGHAGCKHFKHDNAFPSVPLSAQAGEVIHAKRLEKEVEGT
jgi:hypothetical protein